MIAFKGGRQTATKPELLRVLRTIRDGGRPDDNVAGYQAVAEAITAGWLEVLNDRARVERWKYRLTREGAKQAGPVLRLIMGGSCRRERPLPRNAPGGPGGERKRRWPSSRSRSAARVTSSGPER